MENAKMNHFCGKFLNLFIYLFLFKFDNSFFFILYTEAWGLSRERRKSAYFMKK